MNQEQQQPASVLTLRAVRENDWVGVVANAASGRGQTRKTVDALVSELKRRGLDARVAWTLSERDTLVEQARLTEHCRCIVAAGGDGTVSALLNERPSVPIAALPAGTENLFAQQFRFTRNVQVLSDAIFSGRFQSLDVGEIAGRRFGLMAGFGFDAEVVNRHHAFRTRTTGRPRPTHRAEYVDPVLRASFLYRFPSLRLLIDEEETLDGTTAFVFNLPRYALGLPFAPDARADDGLLDVIVFRDGGPVRALHYLWLVLRGLHLTHAGVYHRQVRTVRIESDSVVPIQLDGDPGGTLTPGPDGSQLITVSPRSADVIVVPNEASSTKKTVGHALAASAR